MRLWNGEGRIEEEETRLEPIKHIPISQSSSGLSTSTHEIR